MTDQGKHADEGGEPPCFAPLLGADPPTPVDLADLIEGLNDAVIIADRDGIIAFWNPAASRLFGWSATEAVGERLDLIIPERLRARHWSGFDHVMAGEPGRHGTELLEVPAVHRDGSTLSIAFSITLLRRAGEDRPALVAAVLRDETERWLERRRLESRIADLETPR
jgi:PAS domain S-box-containing protein